MILNGIKACIASLLAKRSRKQESMIGIVFLVEFFFSWSSSFFLVFFGKFSPLGALFGEWIFKILI